MGATKKAAEMTRDELAAYIDHSVLKPELTQAEIRRYIAEGVGFRCKTVCVNPSALELARELCEGTETGICAVCDFPFGLSGTELKVLQAIEICKSGYVDELDVVANYGWMRSGLWDPVERDIRAVADAVHDYDTVLKVIFETDALTPDEVAKATDVACNAGADFVKTSTGFYTGGPARGAAIDVVRCMLESARGRCKVKGSGGIRDQNQFFALIDLGVDRLGIGFKSVPVVLGID